MRREAEAFNSGELIQIAGVTYSQLEYLKRTGLCRPSLPDGRYSFPDLVRAALAVEITHRAELDPETAARVLAAALDVEAVTERLRAAVRVLRPRWPTRRGLIMRVRVVRSGNAKRNAKR